MRNKKASLMHQVIIHLILIALIFALFFLTASYRTESRGVKQQVLEKQLALLIDSSKPETTITIQKLYMKGQISDLKVDSDRIYVYVNNQGFSKGYPYFTKYGVSVDSDQENYLLDLGSKQENLWGINIYPEIEDDEDMIEFDSMINLRPSLGNRSRGVENRNIREKIKQVVNKLVAK